MPVIAVKYLNWNNLEGHILFQLKTLVIIDIIITEDIVTILTNIIYIFLVNFVLLQRISV